MHAIFGFFLTSLLLLTSAYAQPADDVMPDEATLERINDAASVAGQAQACELDWQPYYLTFMQREREGDWTQVQLTYMGAYFGAMQAYHADASAPCDALQRTQAQRKLEGGLMALRAGLSPDETYYPASTFVYEPRLTLPEQSLEAAERICLQILMYKFAVPAPQNADDYRCYTLQSVPEEAMANFRSRLIILGYKLLKEGQQDVLFTLWQRPGSTDTLLLAAVPSEDGAYFVALDSSAGEAF